MLKHSIIHDKPCSDHEGTLYPNIKSMCAHWNIRPETYSRRITVYKMSQEEALTRPGRCLLLLFAVLARNLLVVSLYTIFTPFLQ